MAKSSTAAPEEKESAAETVSEKKPIIPKDIDIHQYVVVRNGFHGRLIYVSKRTGEKFVWEEFGAEQDMELQELRNCKNSNKKFFIKNHFMFDDDWVIDYLGVRQYYKHALRLEEFDELFKKSPTEIEKTIAKLSDGQKHSLSYRARVLIKEGSIDSIKVIQALEKSLGVELVEH